MSRSVIIHGPMPTPEQMADALGVSSTRLANLREVLEKDGFLHAKSVVKSPVMTKKRFAKQALTVGSGPKDKVVTRRTRLDTKIKTT